MTPIDRLNRAHTIAPTPGEHGTREEWMRHYAAQAMAAFAGFYQVTHEPRTGDDRPEIGYLALLSEASVAACIAIDHPTSDLSGAVDVARLLWEHTPDGGALNGEWEECIVDTLDRHGINPADVNERYTASDFTSPSWAVTA